MTTNVGTLDRILRAALGLILLSLALFSASPLFAGPLFKYGAAAIGVVMLATSVLRMCPLYAILGIKTCREC
ncbi:DUF2892 domain-containing protein [Paracoccus sp. TK19116]|uniref:DUF2892 domain-containing protein n=1 Tax=Paracoccus albicereus TaxID=2922394 RepID=A0ABT1MTW4_9RHOB|nr:DUF2892 domain-containing protein [Paracoccus albicereus]MCQ0971772.1 DUF2892 domain-containing protein [Paracoccus albicereus]